MAGEGWLHGAAADETARAALAPTHDAHTPTHTPSSCALSIGTIPQSAQAELAQLRARVASLEAQLDARSVVSLQETGASSGLYAVSAAPSFLELEAAPASPAEAMKPKKVRHAPCCPAIRPRL